MVSKCMNNSDPFYLKELLTIKRSLRALQSLELSLLEIPRICTEKFDKRAFEYAAPHMWNSLHLHIIQSKSMAIFKKAMKTYSFQKILISKYLFTVNTVIFINLFFAFPSNFYLM